MFRCKSIKICFAFVILFVIIQRCHAYIQDTANNARARIKQLIQDLFYDANTKVNKVWFIKKWAHSGSGGHAVIGEMIFNIKKLYSRMVKLYVATMEKYETFRDYIVFMTGGIRTYPTLERLLLMKRMSITIEHLVFVVVEFDRLDPSGKHYGRTGPEVLRTFNQHLDDDKGVAIPTPEMQEKVTNMKLLLKKKLQNWAKLKGYNVTNMISLLRPENKKDDGFDTDKDIE